MDDKSQIIRAIAKIIKTITLHQHLNCILQKNVSNDLNNNKFRNQGRCVRNWNTFKVIILTNGFNLS